MAFRYECPATAEAAIRALAGAAPGTVAVLAGGTDLLLDIDAGRLAPTVVLSLARLPWRELERRDGRLRIGSLRPLREIEKDERIAGDLPGLFQAIRAVGSPALRNRATMGGNIGRSASASDLIPVLLALDARVELVGPEGVRTVPTDALLAGSRRPGLGPGELVRAIDLPSAAPSAYAWQRVRPAHDISQVGVAVAFDPGSGMWRIAVGGVAPVPQRIPSAETGLAGPTPEAGAIDAAAERASTAAPLASDRRATESYRRQVVRVLTARAIRDAVGRGAPSGAGP